MGPGYLTPSVTAQPLTVVQIDLASLADELIKAPHFA
jgi:hypothetical protein